MPKSKLTDISVSKLPPGMHWDLLLPSFGVRVQKKTRTFIIVRDGGHRHRIGHYPALGLADAREKARSLMAGATTRPGSFPEVVDTYVALHLAKNCRPSHHQEIERLLRKHFRFTKPIAHVTKNDILEVIEAIESHSLANHCTVAIKMLFNWATERGYLDYSPISRLKKPYKELSRNRVVTYDELAKIWAASKTMNGYGAIVRLAILIGQRRGELSKIVPEWRTDEAIIFPAAVTKNARPHTIPLTERALAELPKVQKPGAWSKPKVAIDKTSGVTDWVIHDLRRSFSTHLHELGIAPHIVERLLNHALPGVAGVYNRAQHFEEMRQALLRWEAELVARRVIT